MSETLLRPPKLRVSPAMVRARRVAPWLSTLRVALSAAIIAFLLSFYLTEKKWFPYSILHNARKTEQTIRLQLFPPFAPEQFLGFSDLRPADAPRNRIRILAPAPAAPAGEHFLLAGGFDQYLDYCPRYGCIAVEYRRSGNLVHAFPYRPDLLEAHQAVSLPYEQVFFRFTTNVYPIGLLKLPGGDIVVTFQQWNTFPYAGGIARLRPDGTPVWFRHDYSHHWPRLLSANEIGVPAMRIGASEQSFRLGGNLDVRLSCDGKIEEDIVRILDTDGRVKEEIPVSDALVRSPWRGMLDNAAVPCAPVHLNYVAPVTSAMVRLFPDVEPDDLIVSLRDLNAFAIVGRRNHRLKHMFTGTFLLQHSVQPLGQSATVLIFDNHGADWNGGPSRLIAYDLATRSERTLLPNPNARGIGMFSDVAGNISVSPDLSRVIVTAMEDGTAYELNTSDGSLLTLFNNLHDLSTVPEAGDSHTVRAGRFALGGVYYVH
ncbi:MAG: arylsulfotransferase family protein [Rhizomicrobium sp.]